MFLIDVGVAKEEDKAVSAAMTKEKNEAQFTFMPRKSTSPGLQAKRRLER